MYSSSHDGTIRVWDSQTGQCNSCVEVGGEVDAMLIESGFLFAGLKRCAPGFLVAVSSPQGC
jgi:WD40 repeat protein